MIYAFYLVFLFLVLIAVAHFDVMPPGLPRIVLVLAFSLMIVAVIGILEIHLDNDRAPPWYYKLRRFLIERLSRKQDDTDNLVSETAVVVETSPDKSTDAGTSSKPEVQEDSTDEAEKEDDVIVQASGSGSATLNAEEAESQITINVGTGADTETRLASAEEARKGDDADPIAAKLERIRKVVEDRENADRDDGSVEVETREDTNYSPVAAAEFSAETESLASTLSKGSLSITEYPDDEEATPLEHPKYWVQRIFFGTNRVNVSQDNAEPYFEADRDTALHVGTIDITIPKEAHRLGRVEVPRNISIFNFEIWHEPENPEKHFTIQSAKLRDQDEFKSLASEAAVTARTYEASAFLFIHGFNTKFAPAMYRAAQLAHDLGFDGPAFAFSWPSSGTVDYYFDDIESARSSVEQLDEFLDLIVTTPGISKLHVVAHSMGNEALAELMTRAETRLAAREAVAIDQLILAAPDVDAKRFEGIAHHFVRHARGVTLYACASDRAPLLSEKLRRGSPRAGDVPITGPVVSDGIDTIDVTAVGTEIFSLNHNVYARNRGLLDDVGNIFLEAVRPPKLRMPTLRIGDGAQGKWWIMPK